MFRHLFPKTTYLLTVYRHLFPKVTYLLTVFRHLFPKVTYRHLFPHCVQTPIP